MKFDEEKLKCADGKSAANKDLIAQAVKAVKKTSLRGIGN